jgi:hypothetical protein
MQYLSHTLCDLTFLLAGYSTVTATMWTTVLQQMSDKVYDQTRSSPTVVLTEETTTENLSIITNLFLLTGLPEYGLQISQRVLDKILNDKK